MAPHIRKLLPLDDQATHYRLPPTNSSSSPPTSFKFEDRENPTTTCCAYNSLKLNPPFDSAMALTVLVLLTALFFMGFFSIYIRRVTDESSVDPTRRRRSSDQPESLYQNRSRRGTGKGVEPMMIESLPVHAYDGGAVRQGMEFELECAICLSEFEEKERVKEIPYCSHVFHVECIDTWLLSHVTCPLCRTAKLFPVKEEEVGEKDVEGQVAVGVEVEEGRLGVAEVQRDVESSGGV